MFKLFILAALVAVAAARPSHVETAALVYSAPLQATTYVQEPAYAKVGAVIKNIPTAVSHQSQSVVHSSAHVVEPLVAPVVQTTYTAAAAPLYKTYSAAPLVHAAPELTYAAAIPFASAYEARAHYEAPVRYSAW